jgi:fucokinase
LTTSNLGLFYQELKLRQDKGLISKGCLLLSIEDPESPIGSGGATLNALNIVAEALSARNNYKMTQIEVIKGNYILIMHMGRKYPFDVIGKAFASLPFQDDDYNLQTNFDLMYKIMQSQIAGLDKATPHSEPGVYVCSTDMIFMIPETGLFVCLALKG